MAEANLAQALAMIDAAHAEDSNLHHPSNGDKPVPYELHYARKMSFYLDKRAPDASAVLRTAVRAQHFRRWEVPRNTYPATRSGYLQWRTGLKQRQATQTAEICVACGYSEAEAAAVAALIRKEGLKTNAETQILEDVACLVFLDDQLDEYAFERWSDVGAGASAGDGGESKVKVDEERMLGILRKTWAKMSERGRELALDMDLSERARALVEKALSG